MQVTVNVRNVNEHAPICVENPFTFFVQQNSPPNTLLGKVHAVDEDHDDRVTYHVDNSGR